jgi:dTDP-4-amino-4,6-dideoxygalactose transaminase
LHLQKAYKDSRNAEGQYPVTEKLCATVLSLPMHTELDQETLKYISDAVLDFLKQ